MRFLTILLFTVCFTTSAQVLKPDATETFYSEMWNVYNTHKRLSYISFFPLMKVNGDTGLPLLFEANISPYFTFFRGRDYGNYGYSRPHLKSFMIYFNPELTLRMYREEPIGTLTKSLPVLPISFAPKISFVKFLHHTTIPNQVEAFKKYDFLELTIAHYSNGQENPHYLRDTVNAAGDSIPNYLSGNFSTNYWRLAYTHGFMDSHLNIYSINPYIQNDGGAGSLFSYDEAQLKSYGRWRFGVTLQFQSKKTRLGSKKSQKVALKLDSTQTMLDKFEPVRRRTDYYATFTLRLNSETILDNVREYPSDQKHIQATRLTFLLHPLNWRNFGLMAEVYHGRDFYNIRFYDKLTQFKIGILADPAFYLPRNTYE